MQRKSKYGKWNMAIKLTTLSLAFIVVIMLITGLNHISDVYVVKEYGMHNYECWASLTLQSNKTFIFKGYSGSVIPGITMRGNWNKRNDTLELNGMKEIILYKENMRDTLFYKREIFNHAEFKVFHDSIIHINGESSISRMYAYEDY